ncbi:NERD domain-containing protein [Alteromonas macleodii]|jgi:hypothetical protein|uniref:nuclease-related domain-containing protein n=1 Tax=Alteromonas sp. BZK5 TaxID=1904459 RepID=UPI001653605B|nr:nuclease-related domain-containing protein [Alteromonas sp. BZK5]MBC6984437.1 NERD domain-containing protein [Alteromonas sp. BZK5]|tara:strand:- start:10364 stop:11242 length:879 start_codon:yes stop_codon:yes gene_type:complete
MEILFVMAISLFPFALVILFAACYNKITDKKSRIPFDYARTARIPAFTLLQQHRDSSLDMLVYTLLSTLYFQLPFSLPTIAELLGFVDVSKNWLIYGIIFFAAAIYSLSKALRAFSKIRIARLGIEAEWAVSFALSKISDNRVRVFHDVQAPNFNIDHVLTFPGGVLAIETKGRRKPNVKNSKSSHKLTVEGEKIQFPHYTDTSTVEQAKRQADWLSKQLTQSTGMSVVASPVVVIPGWFIEYKQKPVIPIMNNNSLTKHYALSKKTVLDNSSLDRINHQLEALTMRGSDLF